MIRFLAVGKSPIKSSLEKHPESYDETAKNLGLGPFNLLKKIHIPINKFAIVTDINKNIFLTYIKNIKKNNLKKNTVDYENFNQASIIELQSSFYETYDNLLSNKYKVTINQKSLDKVKNLFE